MERESARNTPRASPAPSAPALPSQQQQQQQQQPPPPPALPNHQQPAPSPAAARPSPPPSDVDETEEDLEEKIKEQRIITRFLQDQVKASKEKGKTLEEEWEEKKKELEEIEAEMRARGFI